MPPIFLNDSKLLESVLKTTRISKKTAHPKSIPATEEAFLLFRGVVDARKCMADGRLHARMQCTKGCRMRVALQVVARSRSALLMPTELCSFQTAYSPCFLYEGHMARLQVLELQGDAPQSHSQRESLKWCERSSAQ